MKTILWRHLGAGARVCAALTFATSGIGLSGCADLSPDLAGPEPIITVGAAQGHITMPASNAEAASDSSAILTSTPPDAGWLVKNFQTAANEAATQAAPLPAAVAKPAAPSGNAQPNAADQTTWTAYKPYRDKLARFGKAGVAVANARCELYFKAIGLRARGLSFGADEISLLTTALAAVLKDIDPDTLAAGNVIGGAVSTSMRNFRDAYFYSPDVGNVEKLVDDAANKAAAQLDDESITLSYEGVIGFLTSYQALCQPQMIRNLVNGAVSKSQPDVTANKLPTSGQGATPAPTVHADKAGNQPNNQPAAQPPKQIGAFTIGY